MEILEIDGHSLYRFSVGASRYLLNPFDGARLMNWYVQLADNSARDIIYWPENVPAGGSEMGEVKGGAPILFPFGGSSFVEGKAGMWRTPDGNVLPMHKHGFANWGKFDPFYSSESEIRLRYVPSENDAVCYPYDYEFTVCYRFRELSFGAEFILRNKGAKRMPLAVGYHPYFTLPWHSGLTRKDYRLVCDAKRACYVKGDGTFAPADNLDKMCFADPEMSPRIMTHLKTAVVKFGPKNGEEDITIKIDGGGRPKPGYCVVTWSNDAEQPYYCVEPWMGPPNSSSNPVHFVEPGCESAFSVEIDIS